MIFISISIQKASRADRKPSPVPFRQLSFKDKKIGVLLGGIHDDYARKSYPDATVMQYKSQSDLILAVKTGKVDAAFFTHESLLEMMRSDKELAFLGENLYRIPIGMGFNQNNDELRLEGQRTLPLPF